MTTKKNAPISGKDIVIPDAAPPGTLHQSLQGLLNKIGDACSKHDQVLILIEACIGEAVTKGSDIIAVISALGFSSRHVGMWLAQGCGPSAERNRWFKGADGRYCLHG
jgi:hypothetical protein